MGPTAAQKLLGYDAMAAHVTVLDTELTELRARLAQFEAEGEQLHNTGRALLDAIERTMGPAPGGHIESAADEFRAVLDGNVEAG